MKKAFKLDEIDCANCARELQEGLAKLEGAVGAVDLVELECLLHGGFPSVVG